MLLKSLSYIQMISTEEVFLIYYLRSSALVHVHTAANNSNSLEFLSFAELLDFVTVSWGTSRFL